MDGEKFEREQVLMIFQWYVAPLLFLNRRNQKSLIWNCCCTDWFERERQRQRQRQRDRESGSSEFSSNQHQFENIFWNTNSTPLCPQVQFRIFEGADIATCSVWQTLTANSGVFPLFVCHIFALVVLAWFALVLLKLFLPWFALVVLALICFSYVCLDYFSCSCLDLL